ncbi:MAG: outer membrane protein assembly factor BamD [Acidobacteriota bacterium]|nr:outer membrane protein assembly factor BamD [Blastocatellia bacterium]MDW8412480.1 outer membrane protein assembly factor BamD [Acidobacteriota bacterium]
MKKALILLLLITCHIYAATQGTLQQQPLRMPKNPELEREAKHNLEVARFYFKKKAYKGVTDRLFEIVYTYPEYSKIDEVLWLLAVSLDKLGKKDDAINFAKKLVDEFPESQYAKQTKKLFGFSNTASNSRENKE